MNLQFKTDNQKLHNKFEAAVSGLEKNTIKLHGFEDPVLIEGGHYQGIWLECGPLEGLVFGVIRPEVAVSSHRIFFKHQRVDGYIPLRVTFKGINSSQLQIVVPIAATALETYKLVGDKSFLEEAYAACSRWDDWIMAYRNTRGTGLCEAFCEWDTGHDNSPRFEGLPRKCKDDDARYCSEDFDVLPFLAPDLSASVYGGRVALAEMAEVLGKHEEAQMWKTQAEYTRRAILAYCFDPQDMSFYDLDNKQEFLRIKGDVITRVLSEHVVDQDLFEQIFEKHIMDPEAFWTSYPLPSIAVNDPAFDHDMPENSWGGATQCLTALRAPRWFEHYGKSAELTHMMKQWVKALAESPDFQQQMSPWTGEFTSTKQYSPAMCVLLDFVQRLYGVKAGVDSMNGNETIEWNCRLPEHATTSSFEVDLLRGAKGEAAKTASLLYQDGRATLKLDDKTLMKVKGACRIVTDLKGALLGVIGTDMDTTSVEIIMESAAPKQLKVSPNEYV